MQWIFPVASLSIAAVLFWASGPWVDDRPVSTNASPVVIAVLPFDNISGDSTQDHLADGLTDDLITGLTSIPGITVIARESTILYRGKSDDEISVAEKLKARYVVHGNILRSGGRVLINVHLVDAQTQAHLWAERYEGGADRLFELPDEINRGIMSILAVRVSAGTQKDLGMPSTDNAQAYDAFLQGRQHFYLYSNKDENRQAREHFQQAIALDPDFAMAYAMLAWTHAFDAMNGWAESREVSLNQAQALASDALVKEERLPVAHFVQGLAYRELGQYVKGLVEAEKAIQYDPSYANAYVLLATLLYHSGRPQEGLESVRTAMRLNPHHPYNYSFHLGQAYFFLGRYDEAIDAFRQGLESNPSAERLHLWLAAALANAGEIDEARWEADQVLMLNPEFSLARVEETFRFKDEEQVRPLVDGLLKAGFSR